MNINRLARLQGLTLQGQPEFVYGQGRCVSMEVTATVEPIEIPSFTEARWRLGKALRGAVVTFALDGQGVTLHHGLKDSDVPEEFWVWVGEFYQEVKG
jgi:hypothetical protein